MKIHRLPVLKEDKGSVAVEFALLAPVLALLIFALIGFGIVISVNNGLQQIVAEAARASIAGLDDGERASLARDYVSRSVSAYPFVNPSRLNLTTTGGATTFQVSVTYDMSGSVAFTLPRWVPLPPPVVTRSAVVRLGGF